MGFLAGKRIVIVLYSLELGGAERQAILLARHLKVREGAAVEVWGFCSPGKAARLCEESGVPWRLISLDESGEGLTIRSSLMLAGLLRKARAEVVLSYLMYPNILCSLAWRLTKARLFVWNQRNPGTEWVDSRLQRAGTLLTPLFIANSTGGASFLIDELGVKRSRVHVIPNGVQLAMPRESRRDWRARLGFDDTTLIACMVANLSGYKDHETLLKAWRLVVDRLAGRPCALLLAGRFDGAYPRLEALAKELRITDSVGFLGMVDDVAGLLKAVDIFAFSSPSEGCPNAVLEAMAAGLPIAATDIPAIREVIGEEGYPFLARAGDPVELSGRIIALLTNKHERERMGAVNRSRAEGFFSLAGCLDRTTALITEGLKRRFLWCHDA